jgi:hypothetical protein
MTLTGGPGVLERIRRPSAGRAPGLGAAGLGAGLGAAVSWLMHRALGDDALISVAYARTLAGSGTWGVFPGITANTQTSPLNAWLLAAGIAVTDRPVLVVGALLCACLAACGWLATAVVRDLGVSPVGGWLAVVLVGTSPVLVSTVGLETYLAATVLLAIVAAALRGRVLLTGLLCGLAVLTRPDLAVPALVLALALGTVAVRPVGAGRRSTDLAVVVLTAAVVALPWHVWSWFALGGAVPDTTWVRTGDRSGPTILPAVSAWGQAYPAATIAGVLPVLAALLCVVPAVLHRHRRWARTVLLLVAAGWAHLLALAAIEAQGAAWYYAPVVVCSSVAVAITAAVAGPRPAAVGAVAVGVAALVGALTTEPVPWTWAPLVSNYARTEQYAAIARQLPVLTGGQPVRGPGELGALAFYGSVPVLDVLSEPAETDRVMEHRRAAGGVRATLMGASSAHRRSAPPIPTRWVLSFGTSRVEPPGRVVRTWPVDTPVHGPGAVVLTETP